ncbi:MAG: gamma-glutamyltransferase [Bacteroidia bacterium]
MRYLATWLVLLAACRPLSPTYSFDPQRTSLVTERDMVVSAHPLATAAGVQVLAQGGNAVDAAVAVQLALAVVLPAAGNIGGGGFMVLRGPDGQVHTLDYRETAPAAAHRDMYLDSLGEVVAAQSWRGHRAAGVPGSVAGMWAAHDSLGYLPWPDLVQPAIDLAARGFALTPAEADGLNEKREDLLRYSTRPHPYAGDRPWQPGDTLRLPALAETLARIRDAGAAGFYTGPVADSLVAEMQRGGGHISHADLQAYRPVWRPPVVAHYRDLRIISMGPPSSGGIALAQLLALVEPYPLADYGFQSVEAVHLMVEAERRVYADRAAHLGDPDFYPVPVQGLLDSAYLAGRMADFDPARATVSAALAAGAPREHEETTHLSIVDAAGNAVAVTTTLNGGYGSCVVVGGAGFLLNNEMDDFSSKPGVPNAYGLVGAEANAIAPGKRMLSSMTPTIVERQGQLYMVVGTPGGSTIITSVFQTILAVHAFGFRMQGAVDAPRFHHQWLPDAIQCETAALSPAVRSRLAAMGHSLTDRSPIGRVDAILVRPDGRLEAGADPRGDDTAGGH